MNIENTAANAKNTGGIFGCYNGGTYDGEIQDTIDIGIAAGKHMNLENYGSVVTTLGYCVGGWIGYTPLKINITKNIVAHGNEDYGQEITISGHYEVGGLIGSMDGK